MRQNLRTSKKGSHSAQVAHPEEGPKEEPSPSFRRILLKGGDGATYELEVRCHQGGDLFRAFQASVERETGMPAARQRFFIANGTRLSTGTQLDSACNASREAGETLVVRVLPKTDSFGVCEKHPNHEKTAFCVPCRTFLCFKCLFTHVNNTAQVHTLADVEDGTQFNATVSSVLQQADQRLHSVIVNAERTRNSHLQNSTAIFDRFIAQREHYSNALLTCFEFAIAKQRRQDLRTTTETANWLGARKQQSARLQQLAQQGRYYNSWGYCAQGQNPPPKLALTASANFTPCGTHANQTQCLYCVQCAKTMCPKCFALHGNQNHGHQCADMEDSQQFLAAVQREVDKIDAEMQNAEVCVVQMEQQQLQQLNSYMQQLWPQWTAYVDALKAEFAAEAKQIERNRATTPLELAEWLRGQ